jgi:hypothetical protein
MKVLKRNFLHPPVASALFGSIIPPSALFPSPLYLRFSLKREIKYNTRVKYVKL